MNPAREQLQQKFESLFGDPAPRIFRAPGRVNIIGEHTDYNDGFVLPAAIDLYISVAITVRSDRQLIAHSENFSETVAMDLDNLRCSDRHHWSNYIRGGASVLESSGYRLQGADLLIHGEVPLGSGLSSSAALEVASALALLETAGLGADRLTLARICQRAEDEFVGMRCGIMDQFISCFGRTGYALLLDCRSLEHRPVPLEENVSLVICNSRVKHALAGSEYNRRRADCEQGVRLLSREIPNVRALRDIRLEDLERCATRLPAVIYRRCLHVIEENARVQAAVPALESRDLAALGRLLAESHQSLRTNYEVTCPELDLLVDLATGIDGVYGARMTGAGFGGCTINLVQSDRVPEFKRLMGKNYQQATGLAPEIYVCSSADGAHEVFC